MNKYFGTDGIRGMFGTAPITEGCFTQLGRAIAIALEDKYNQNIVLIGRDTRHSGEALESALIKGLSSGGVNCLQLGIVPTPVIGFLTPVTHSIAGLVISASHNPADQNGLKIFSNDGIKLPDKIEQAIVEAFDNSFVKKDNIAVGQVKFWQEGEGLYIDFCKKTFPFLFQEKRLKMILDCANGATFQLAPKIFSEIATEIITLNVTPDGNNINENCGATNLESLKKAVLKEKADIGIAFDGDGDRLMMVDHSGEIVDGDELLFIMANYLKESKQIIGGVVGTVMSNIGLEFALKRIGVEFSRSRVGDHFVYDKLKEQNWFLGGEPSGHLLLLDKSTTGDGILSALQIVYIMAKSGQSLHALRQGMKKYPQVLINVSLRPNTDILANPKVESAIQQTEDELKNLEGRIVIRYSGTEPLLRVMLEGKHPEKIQHLADDLVALIKREQG